MNSGPRRHQRNPRGQGQRLRTSIITAASELLQETGDEDAITLRAVARRIGISAPAIYAHFADREAILEAVVRDAFAELLTAVSEAADSHTDPVEYLRAVCQAYLTFADDRPGRFRLMFGRHRTATPGIPPAESVHEMVGGEAFATLINGIEACVATGHSPSQDPVRDATIIWTSLHGYAILRTNVPYFPWPPPEVMIDDLLTHGASITTDVPHAAPASAGRAARRTHAAPRATRGAIPAGS